MALEVAVHTNWWPEFRFPPINLWSVWPRRKKMNRAIDILRMMDETGSEVIIESSIYYVKDNVLCLHERWSNDLEANIIITKPLHEILELLNKMSEEEYIKLIRDSDW